MKKRTHLVILFGTIFLLLETAKANEFSNNIQAHLTQTALDALAEDLGSVMGGGSFHKGKSVGFPFGVDVGIHVPVVGVQTENKILSDDDSTFHAEWVQLEIGLPGKLNLIGRVGDVFGTTAYGVGLGYGIFRTATPGVPSVMVSGLYSTLDDDVIEVDTVSANLVVSFDFPFIHPYAGVGYDKTNLDVRPLTLIDSKVDGFRVEGGINVSVIPFTYINLGAGLANKEHMLHVGMGVKI